VLYCTGDQVAGSARSGLAGLDCTEDGEVHRLRTRCGEGKLVGAAAKVNRDGFPGLVEQQPCSPALAMQAGWVGPAVIEGS
jgi:hypothetical protein